MNTADELELLRARIDYHAAVDEIEHLRARIDALTGAGDRLSGALNDIHRNYHDTNCTQCAAWMGWLNTAHPVGTNRL